MLRKSLEPEKDRKIRRENFEEEEKESNLKASCGELIFMSPGQHSYTDATPVPRIVPEARREGYRWAAAISVRRVN